MRTAIVFALLSTSACSSPAEEGVRRHQITGAIVSHDTSSGRAVVAHEAVNDLMPAMSMDFAIRGPVAPMRAGDRISAALVVASTQSWLEDVRVTAAGRTVRDSSRPTDGATPGAIVPAFSLLDQNSRPLTMHGFAGRVVVITFIYTRCPLPDLCPLMVKHLEMVRRRLDREGIGGVALLAVTLDPTFDTPAVLRTYADAVLKGPDPFERWTFATGTPEQIEEVAGFFGVGYRAEAGLVSHTLATSVVSHDGRLMQVFESNSWAPDELFAVVQRGVDRAAAE